MTEWSKHVHRFAKKHNMSYKQANVSKKCKEAYKKRKKMSPRKKTSPRRRRMNPPTKKRIYSKEIYPELLTPEELNKELNEIKEKIQSSEDTLKEEIRIKSLKVPETEEDLRRIKSLQVLSRRSGQTLEQKMDEDISDTIENIELLRNAAGELGNEIERRGKEVGYESEKEYENLDKYETYAGRVSHYERSPKELKRALNKTIRSLQSKTKLLNDLKEIESKYGDPIEKIPKYQASIDRLHDTISTLESDRRIYDSFYG